MRLANAIRKERKGRGWTQEDLADVLKTGPAAVQNWESGRCLPRADVLPEIEDAFKWPRGQTLRIIKGECTE